MKKILGFVVLSLFAISASAADLMASSTAPTVTQNIVVEGAACPGVGATGFSSTGLLLSCQSGLWKRTTVSFQAFSKSGTSQEYCHVSNNATGSCTCSPGLTPNFTGFSYAGATPYFWYYLCKE